MKGSYINTVIIMAAKSGKTNKRQHEQKETIRSLKDFKIIWSKNGNSSSVSSQPSVL